MAEREDRSEKRRTVQLVSAGGVVYRRDSNGVSVVLCGRREPLRWSLPKGTPNPGETLEQTAAREVQEETGYTPKIVSNIGGIEYWFVRPEDGARCHKTVHFYLMVPVSGDPSLHDPEFDDVRWFSADDARRTLTYANEVRVLERALAMVPAVEAAGLS